MGMPLRRDLKEFHMIPFLSIDMNWKEKDWWKSTKEKMLPFKSTFWDLDVQTSRLMPVIACGSRSLFDGISRDFLPNFITKNSKNIHRGNSSLIIVLFCFFSPVTNVMVNDGEIFPSVFIIACRVIVKTRIFDFKEDFIVLNPSFFSFCWSIIVQ